MRHVHRLRNHAPASPSLAYTRTRCPKRAVPTMLHARQACRHHAARRARMCCFRCSKHVLSLKASCHRSGQRLTLLQQCVKLDIDSQTAKPTDVCYIDVKTNMRRSLFYVYHCWSRRVGSLASLAARPSTLQTAAWASSGQPRAGLQAPSFGPRLRLRRHRHLDLLNSSHAPLIQNLWLIRRR